MVRPKKKIDARGHRQLAEACYIQRRLEASSALAAASWRDEHIAWSGDVHKAIWTYMFYAV